MRRRRKFDRMLMTTALVLVSAVFVVFSIRLIMRSNDTDHAPQFLPADEMFLVGLTTSGSGSDAGEKFQFHRRRRSHQRQ